MKIFVTGGTGFVGSAVIDELKTHGDEVLALARSEASEAALRGRGVQVLRGDVDDPAVVREGARRCDGVIHTAFNTSFDKNDTRDKLRQSSDNDRRVIEALGAELQGTERPLLVTTGTAVLAPGALSGEHDHIAYTPEQFPRVVCETGADRVAAQGVRIGVVRLSPTVHGPGDHGFVPLLIRIAREKGFSAFVGDGLNRWSSVHRQDAACLYRLALRRVQPGSRFHAVGTSAVAFRDLATTIGQGLGLPVRSISQKEATAHFGWFAFFASLDVPSSADRTRDELGWRPQQPGLLEDLRAGHYFR